ncbi:hypothetical protein L218DRAFT_216388 [Marasmius fiardii PR-910]|nr:hypothetical protein L218DRAFT_216388 [Marasmius fiardii PR-910]
MSINLSSNFTVEGSIFNHVGGNQVNHYHRIIQNKGKMPARYSEYFTIKTGALHLLREIYSYDYPRRWDTGIRSTFEQRLPRADRRVYSTEIHAGQGSIFTAIAYSGPDAVEVHSVYSLPEAFI